MVTQPKNVSPAQPVNAETAPHMNVESFNLDHRRVIAPFIRLADRKVLPSGCVIVKYDIRFCQPNAGHLPMRTVHSLEHMVAEFVRNHDDGVLDFSPMGCQTGFYLMLAGDRSFDDVAALVEATLTDVTKAEALPAANTTQCGWGHHHSLDGAKQAAADFLAQRDEWAQVAA